MMNTLKTACTALLIALSGPALASEPILRISGDVASPAEGQEWHFDLADLQAIDDTQFTTTTIWTEGNQSFTGVSLAALMAHVGAHGETLRAVALNDYAVTIPLTDAIEGGPIIAYERNGSPMSIRDKGPLWIVYPFDDIQAYKSEEYYARSIWQLSRIEIAKPQ